MTLESFAQKANFDIICMPEPQKDVKGVYIGDLLSWVMGKAESGNAWITIMTNVNVVAVATLADVSCVVLAEGVLPEESVIAAAKDKGVNILSTPLTQYEAAKKISAVFR